MAEEKKFNDIVIEKVADGNYAVVSINRPDKLNSLSTDTLREISEALDMLAVDSTARCVVLRGTKNFTKKPAFSAGADLAAPMPGGLNYTIPVHNDLFMQIKHKYYDLIEAFPKPLIAAVDGYAFGGGCELTLVCDLVIASKRSEFGFPEIKRGIFPANGGTQRMVQHIGMARTKLMIYTADNFSAEKMMEWGYVASVVDVDKFEEEVHKVASLIGKGPTTSYYVIKKCMNYGTQVPRNVGLVFEQLAFGLNSTSPDVVEGVTAFFSKKAPDFKGF